MPVDDRLRQAGGSRGEEHVERVRERDRVELERPWLGEQVLPRERARKRVVGPARVRDVDDVLQRRQPRAYRGHLLATVDVPVPPAIAGDRHQDGRLELAQPVEDAARPELGGAGRPDRAEARRGQEGDERLGDVRHIGDDTVAGPDAEPLEPHPRPPDLLTQLTVGQLERATGLRAREQRDRVEVLVTPHGVRRVIEPRSREPLGAGHGVGGEHPLVRRRRPDLEEVPERAPEAFEVRDRPAMEVVVVGEREPTALEPVEVPAHLAEPAGVGGGRPQHPPLDDLALLHGHGRRSRGRAREPGRADCSRGVATGRAPLSAFPRPPPAFASLRRTTCARPRRTGTG